MKGDPKLKFQKRKSGLIGNRRGKKEGNSRKKASAKLCKYPVGGGV